MGPKTALCVALVFVFTKSVLSQNSTATPANNTSANAEPETGPKAEPETGPKLVAPTDFNVFYSSDQIFAKIGTEYFVRLRCSGDASLNWKIAKENDVIAETFGSNNASRRSSYQRDIRFIRVQVFPSTEDASLLTLEIMLMNIQCGDAGTYHCYSDENHKKNLTVVTAFEGDLIVYDFHCPCPAELANIQQPVVNSNVTTNGTNVLKPQPEPEINSANMTITPVATIEPGARCNFDNCIGQKYVAFVGQNVTVTCAMNVTGANSNATIEWLRISPGGGDGNSEPKRETITDANIVDLGVNTEPPNECIDTVYMSTANYAFTYDAYKYERIRCLMRWTFINPKGGPPAQILDYREIQVCIPGGKEMPTNKPTEKSPSPTKDISFESADISSTAGISSKTTGKFEDEYEDVGVQAEAKSNTAAIVGGVVGGVGLIALVAVGALLYKRQQGQAAKASSVAGSSTPNPFADPRSASASPRPKSKV